jgi:peptidylprolyl isomerase
MGFWNDLKNAAPHKAHSRGRELYAAEISSIEKAIGFNPSEHRDAELSKCEVCHVTFGATLSGNSYPCIVQVSIFDHLSFGKHLPAVVACNKCIDTFNLDIALERTEAKKAAIHAEQEAERKAAERRAAEHKAAERDAEQKKQNSENYTIDKTNRSSKTNSKTTDPLVLQCQKCNQSLNIPKGKKLKVSCPTCGNSWIHDGTSSTSAVDSGATKTEAQDRLRKQHRAKLERREKRLAAEKELEENRRKEEEDRKAEQRKQDREIRLKRVAEAGRDAATKTAQPADEPTLVRSHVHASLNLPRCPECNQTMNVDPRETKVLCPSCGFLWERAATSVRDPQNTLLLTRKDGDQSIAATPVPDPQNTLLLTLKDGGVTIELRPDLAPRHVARIKELVRQKFYDGLTFHRVIDGFMAQGGDPYGNGTGGSGQNITAEFSDEPHVRGTVSMARSGHSDSADSQFFIVLQDSPHLDGQYSVWGRVVDGMEYVSAIRCGNQNNSGMVDDPDRIISMQIADDV